MLRCTEFYCFSVVGIRNGITYGEGRNISVTRLRYSANHNALDSWPIRARLGSQNDDFVKIGAFSERRGIEE